MKKRIVFLALAFCFLLALSACSHEHSYDAAWENDASHHWHICAEDSCGEIADKAAHTGGTATETEKAVCEVCGREYGELKAHEHIFGEWNTKLPATCTEAEVEYRVCACGEEETRTGDAALGHSYTEEAAEEAYLASANCGEKATYYKSCSCGAKGTEPFEYGEVIAHSYTAAVTAPTCTEAGYTTYTCSCGDSYTADNTAALGHNMVHKADNTYHWTACKNQGCNVATKKTAHTAVSISVKKINFTQPPMEGEVVEASDLTVHATCHCGAVYPVTKGIELENTTLALGQNTVTVKLGELSTSVNIEAVKFHVVLNGSIVEDTYVASDSGTAKKSDYSERTTLGAYSKYYRIYLKYSFSDILASGLFAENKDNAKVQFVFTLSKGTITQESEVTFGGFLPGEGVSNVNFSELYWNNVIASGAYPNLHWSSAVDLLSAAANSENVGIDGSTVTLTFTYKQIADFIDENGNAVFTLRINTSGISFASMENTDVDIPEVKVILNDDHFHAYTEEVAQEKYLVSANCGEKAVYYKSCTCGEAGTATFEFGDIIPHTYGEWETLTAATCESAEVEHRSCGCGAEETREGEPALDHNMVTACDATYHWTECDREGCDEATEQVAHFGGEATETEKAVCEGCGQPYGGYADHVHSYNAVVTAPTCTEVGFTTYTCDCGHVYVDDEVAVLGHNMVTKHDETHHWTECDREGCDEATEPAVHSGGEATETEQAVCETCGQPYGELKEAEKTLTTIAGSIVEDTYVGSNSSSAKQTDNSQKETLGTYSSYYRTYFKFNFKDILEHQDFEANKADAKVQFSFAVAAGTVTDETKFTFGGFTPGAGVTDVDFSEVYWNNLISGGSYTGLHWTNANNILDGVVPGDKVSYADGLVTFTFDYSEIAEFIDPTTGDAVFTFRIGTTSGISLASMESSAYPAATVHFCYYC